MDWIHWAAAIAAGSCTGQVAATYLSFLGKTWRQWRHQRRVLRTLGCAQRATGVLFSDMAARDTTSFQQRRD